MLGTACAVPTLAVTTTLVGCADESQPEYWVEKMEDPPYRARAVKRLEQFFDDTVNRANDDLSAPEVKALADKTVEPLTQAYVNYYGEMDTKTRVTLVKLLAAYRDPRTEPALKKAFEEFAKKPKSTTDEKDIKWAIRAASDLKLDGLADPILAAFNALKASTMLGGIVYKDYSAAMKKIANPSWSGELKAKLKPEIKPPKTAKDKDLIDPYRDQLFWQITAAEVLGNIQDSSAVEPLLKVLLDPAKADVHSTAILALVKIGKPAVAAATALISGKSDKLEAFQQARMKALGDKNPPKDEYIATAALVLGTAGRSEGLAPLIKVLKNEDVSEENRAIVARELAKIPATKASKQAFMDAFESISLDTEIPPGLNALTSLAEAAGQFYDPDMVDWMLERASETKGSGEDLKTLQNALAVTALKVAKPKQMRSVKRAINRYGTDIEKDLYAKSDELTKACTSNVSCYLSAIEKGENQEQKNQFAGIKAGYMIAILGDQKVRDDLIERLESIDNAAVRFTAAQAIDHLSPKGSKDVAEKLEAIIEKNLKTADKGKIAADAPLKQVMYRVGARG